MIQAVTATVRLACTLLTICRLYFAFPKELAARESEFPLIFSIFYPSFKEEKGIKEYLSSERRLAYSNGIFRHYPELDRQ
jgi:glutathione S-transferase